MFIKSKLGKTIWWSNIRNKSDRRDNRTRIDHLIGFNRHYLREHNLYIYRFTFFRFSIGVTFS